MKFKTIVSLLVLLATSHSVWAADETFQPFILASVNDASLSEQAAATIDALEHAGFRLAGDYAPLDNTRVVVVTSDELLAIAAGSDRGGYAAGQRVSITERDGKSEVAFINPLYLQHAYRLEGDMQVILDRLSEALGKQETYGAEKKMTAKKLGKYRYMPMMQKFDDPSELGSFESHEAAVQAVAEGLAVEDDGLTEVYRIAIPGTEQVVFGVGMKAMSEEKDQQAIDEAHQLSIVDFEGYSKVAYFPYEILVNGDDVEALHMRFRMAVHFPDLNMMGEHGFTKLMASPGATEDAFEALVSGE
ncbi:MAG: hypothetical protein KJN94_02865 [Gammaproteobacteria bacterium]|nr:hypothetical protein [Gammaproteobacteria bacterium]